MAHRNGYFADVPFIPPIEASTFFDDLRHCKAHRLPRSHMYHGSSDAFFSLAPETPSKNRSSSNSSAPWLLTAPPAQTAFPPLRGAAVEKGAAECAQRRYITVASTPYRKNTAIASAVAAARSSSPPVDVRVRFPRVAQDFCDLYDDIITSSCNPIPDAAHDGVAAAAAGGQQHIVFVVANADELMNESPACCAWLSVFCLLLASYLHSGMNSTVPEVLFTVLNDEQGETCGDLLQAYWEGIVRVAVRREVVGGLISELEPQAFSWGEFIVEESVGDAKPAANLSERRPRPLLRDVLTSTATAVVDQHQAICDAMLDGSLPVGESYVVVVFAPSLAVADVIIADAKQRYVAEPLQVATIEELRVLPLPLEAAPVITVCSTIDDLSNLRAVIEERGTLVLRTVVCAAVAVPRGCGTKASIVDSVARCNFACDASLHSKLLHLLSPADATATGAEVVMLKPKSRCCNSALPRAEGLWFQKRSSSSAPFSRSPDFVELGSSVGPMVLWLFRRCQGKPQAVSTDSAAPSLLLSLSMFLGVAAGMTEVPLRSAVEYLATTQCVDVQTAPQQRADDTRSSLHLCISITPLGRFISEGWKARAAAPASRSSSIPPEERISGHNVILRSKLVLSFATFCLGLNAAVEILASLASPPTSAEKDAPLTFAEVARWCARRRVLLSEGGNASTQPDAVMTHDMRCALTRLCVLWSLAPHDDLVQRALNEGERHSLRRMDVLLCASAARRRAIVERHSGEGVTGWCRGWYGSSTVSVVDVGDPQTDGGDASAAEDGNAASTAARRVQNCDAVPLFRFPPAHELCDIAVRRAAARVNDPYAHLMELPVDLSETLVAAKILISSLLENNCILSQVEPLLENTSGAATTWSEPQKRPAATLAMDKKLLGSVTLTSILCGSDSLHSVGGATASGLWIDGIVYDSSTAPMTRQDELQHQTQSAPSMLEFCDHVAYSKQASEARRAGAAAAKTRSSDVFEGITPSAREKVVIDQLVETAARIGRARVEGDLKGKRGFGFLSEGDPHHAYYLYALSKKVNSAVQA